VVEEYSNGTEKWERVVWRLRMSVYSVDVRSDRCTTGKSSIPETALDSETKRLFGDLSVFTTTKCPRGK